MEPKPIKIALAETELRQNDSLQQTDRKPSTYRQLAGRHDRKKEGTVKGLKHVTIQDLPGIYSLSPYTPEEEISRNYLLDEEPDVILNIVDSSNLERNLYLTTQLLELDIPVVVALNFIDVTRRDGDKIDSSKLEKRLGCPVVETSALKGEGVDECIASCLRATESEDRHAYADKKDAKFSADVEKAINEIESVIGDVARKRHRWIAIKAFERDTKALNRITLTASQQEKIEAIIRHTEEKLDDDSESIITTARYEAIKKLTDNVIVRAKRKDNLTRSDRIDRVVTHRFWAYPIFIVVMAALYYIH